MLYLTPKSSGSSFSFLRTGDCLKSRLLLHYQIIIELPHIFKEIYIWMLNIPMKLMSTLLGDTSVAAFRTYEGS